MNVSYSTVRRLHSDVSSTAPRQQGGYKNRLTPKDQPPLNSKVMSGAVSNGSQLKKCLNQDFIMCETRTMSKKGWIESADSQ